ncbi:NUDIX hydrolase domain-like protein [Nemania sp. FL0031]|nr:NUDIX hydrolase domain-like protein [Nemania sp. FL0031]
MTSEQPLLDVPFRAHPGLENFLEPPLAFKTHEFSQAGADPPPNPTYLATSAIVFEHQSSSARTGTPVPPPKVLLVQRAPTDSMPLLWETPGGGCDNENESMLRACARELKEEAGLEAVSIGPLIPCPYAGGMATAEKNPDEDDIDWEKWAKIKRSHFFRTRKGCLVAKYYFMVETSQTDKVVLNPAEHVAYLWATEEEVRNKKMKGEGGQEGMELKITTEEQRLVLLEAFEQWNESIENDTVALRSVGLLKLILLRLIGVVTQKLSRGRWVDIVGRRA